MKFRYLIAAFAMVATGTSFAASGVFGTGVVLGVNGTKTLYTTTLLGDSRHAPVNVSAPSIVTGLPADLGTFDTDLGNTLSFMGGEGLTYKNGTDDILGLNISYSIDGGSFVTFGLSFNQDNVNGAGGDQRWWGEGAGIDLTALSNGAHTLDVYYTSPFTYSTGSGTHVVDNSGAFYSTTFTVIPEPTSAALGLIGVGLLLRRRRI